MKINPLAVYALVFLLTVPFQVGAAGLEPALPTAWKTAAWTSEAAANAATHTLPGSSSVAASARPDTTRPTPADTTRRRALVPEAAAGPADDQPTRKTTLLTLLAIVVLTVSTLLLYNVRSR